MRPKTLWEVSHRDYEAVKAAQKRLRAAMTNYNRKYERVGNAFLRNTETYAKSLRGIRRSGSTEALDTSFCTLKEASAAHEAALVELNAALDAYFEIQREYTNSAFNRLKDDHGMLTAQIADAFGIYHITLSRWMQADMAKRKEMCENEAD